MAKRKGEDLRADVVPEVVRQLELSYAALARENFNIYALSSTGSKPIVSDLVQISQGSLRKRRFLIISARSTLLPRWDAPEHYEQSHLLSIRVHADSDESIYDMKTLAVKWRGKWMDFAKYLERFMAEPNFSSTRAFRRTLGDQGWSTLFDWYRDSGRPFRFLELPLELRTMIYASGIGNDIYPKVKEQGIILQDGIIYDMSLGNGWTPEPPFPFLADTDDPDERVACPDKSMTRLCKQTRREVFECAWRSARVNFPNSLRLYKISLIRPQLPTYALNHLGLNFSNLGYLRFLGGDVEVAPGNRDIIDTHTITRSPPAFILIDGRLPNLKKLDIKFRSTRWAQYTNPVTVAHKKAGLYLVFGRGNIPGFCQKKFTLLILNLLLQYTCHIDEVTIEGDVKHSTLQHFRQALAEKKAQGIPGYHGSFYYARDNYFAQYMDSGTFCYCSKPCMPVDSSLNPPDEVIQQKVRSYQFDFAD